MARSCSVALKGTIKRTVHCSLLWRQGVAWLYCHIYNWQPREPGTMSKARCVWAREKKAPLLWKGIEIVCLCVQCFCLTSNNGQLCSDRHLSLTVACHTLIDVLISGCSEWLNPQHSTCTLIKLYCLDSHKTTGIHISHSRGNNESPLEKQIIMLHVP